MQTTTIRSTARPASGYWTYPDAGTRQKGYPSRREERTANAQAVRRSDNDFLTAIFEPIPVSQFSPIYSSKNYKYLYQSVKNYAKLLGAEIDLEANESDFDGLYKSLDALLPKNQYVDIIEEKKQLKFKISDNRDEGLLYFIPCRMIDDADGELKEIYTSFFSIFQRSQRLTPMSENVIFEYITEELPEDPNEINEEDDWLLLLNDYTNGKIAETLALVDTKSRYTIQQLLRKIKKYSPQSESEKKILKLMSQGLELFCHKKSILHFAYDNYRDMDEDEREYDPVSIDRIIVIVYDTYDLMSETMFDWVSQEAGEQGFEFLSAGSIVLSPQTKTQIELDPFVEEFLNWINTFSYELCNV